MRIGLLTSSRADFGIYYPLAKRLQEDPAFDLEIIAFGTHLKEEYGSTIQEIEAFGFTSLHRVETPTDNNKPEDTAVNIGVTIGLFSSFWSMNSFDLVFTLGDRYEMFAAVSAGLPFNVNFAHIHGGETTLGAIDNSLRHCISLMAKHVFVTTEDYKSRAKEIVKQSAEVYNVGALSIDNLMKQDLFSIEEFKSKFEVDLTKPTLLSTFHPETVSLHKNEVYINELVSAFEVLKDRFQIIITMPNSDTMGDIIRQKIIEFGAINKDIILVESLGMKGYLSCMKHCALMVGNTSSGFVEAAFFPKWVINLGHRQDGRILTPNIINCEVEKDEILKAVDGVSRSVLPNDLNVYGNGNTSELIVKKVKEIYGL